MCFEIIEDALGFLEESVSFNFDPEIVFDCEEEYISLGICQNELVF